MISTQNMIIGLVVIAAVALGWYVFAGQSDTDVMMEKDDAAMMEEKDTMKGEDDMMKKDEDTMMKAEGDTMSKGSYEAYSPEKLALAAKGDVLLFFHADWCPICRAIDAQVSAGALIPAGVHILKVDYDNEIALRQKYGVTVQHTFVQVDAKGTAMQKFMDETTISGVLARVK